MKVGDIKELIDSGSINKNQYNWTIENGNISIVDKSTKENLSVLDLNSNHKLSEKVMKYLGIEKYIDKSKK